MEWPGRPTNSNEYESVFSTGICESCISIQAGNGIYSTPRSCSLQCARVQHGWFEIDNYLEEVDRMSKGTVGTCCWNVNEAGINRMEITCGCGEWAHTACLERCHQTPMNIGIETLEKLQLFLFSSFGADSVSLGRISSCWARPNGDPNQIAEKECEIEIQVGEGSTGSMTKHLKTESIAVQNHGYQTCLKTQQCVKPNAQMCACLSKIDTAAN